MIGEGPDDDYCWTCGAYYNKYDYQRCPGCTEDDDKEESDETL